MHGYAIMKSIKDHSDAVLQVGESSLYPALQRLLLNGWVEAEWGTSENNRRARYYKLTPAGRAHLRAETKNWVAYADTVTNILTVATNETASAPAS
jgi:PadR family transcriptional regulator, regulatory protein PadR